ncbi:MAG: 50S ribosomal protein L25 [Deltaproteobacteria bacterium]|nr:50S ribosomal protein L25 [Deltaproteobacteria bacterium]
MDAVNISSEDRSSFGKGSARKLRAAGRIPAVVYRGGAAATHISIDPAELETAFRKTNNRNTLVAIEASGGKQVCLVKEVQRNPLSQAIVHVDFFEVDPAEDVRVEVNLVPVGTAMGVKMGGRLRTLRRTVDVVCKPADIPAKINADVSEVEVGRFYKLSNVTPPAGASFPYSYDFNLYTVVGKRVEA